MPSYDTALDQELVKCLKCIHTDRKQNKYSSKKKKGGDFFYFYAKYLTFIIYCIIFFTLLFLTIKELPEFEGN